RDLVTRTIERLEHLAEDVDASDTRLLERALEDLGADAGRLDVHLKAGDPALRAGDLEVHVAVAVLASEDVAQDRHSLAVRDEPHRDARDRLADPHTGVHESHGPAADGRHR